MGRSSRPHRALRLGVLGGGGAELGRGGSGMGERDRAGAAAVLGPWAGVSGTPEATKKRRQKLSCNGRGES